MASRFITTDTIVASGYAVDLTGNIDDLYVGANATVGTESAGVGVRAQSSANYIFVAGHIFGPGGISYTANSTGGAVSVYAGGSVTGSGTAISFDGTSGAVTNAGTIAGNRGIYSDGNTTVTNSGSIFGQLDAVFVIGDGTVVNTGLLVANNAVYVNGQADISNYGMMRGEVITQGFDDTLVNRGTITGTTQTGAGNDLVDGIGGRFEKLVDLGAGNDTFWGGSGADVVSGGVGNDEIDGGEGNDMFVVVSGDGSDDYIGGGGSDYYDAHLLTDAVVVELVNGLAKNGGGTDLLFGIERVYGGSGHDRLTGDAMGNLLRGGAGNDVLFGGDGNDFLSGGLGRNSLYGDNGNDRMIGGGNADLLYGGAGNDQITGGLDVDYMVGGTGADKFIFTDFEEFIPMATANLDRIVDFERGADKIDLSAIDALAAAGDQAFSFVGTAAILAFGQLNYHQTSTTTIVSIGFNTASAFDVIRLDGLFTLTAADFIL